jgi:hypothetical protein
MGCKTFCSWVVKPFVHGLQNLLFIGYQNLLFMGCKTFSLHVLKKRRHKNRQSNKNKICKTFGSWVAKTF